MSRVLARMPCDAQPICQAVPSPRREESVRDRRLAEKVDSSRRERFKLQNQQCKMTRSPRIQRVAIRTFLEYLTSTWLLSRRPPAAERTALAASASAPFPGTMSTAGRAPMSNRSEGLTVERAQIDGTTGAAARTRGRRAKAFRRAVRPRLWATTACRGRWRAADCRSA